MLKYYSIIPVVFLGAVVALPATPTIADDQLLEEVVVSGLRTEDRRSLPSSISVLSAEEIAESAVQHFEEVTHQIPNLNWSGGVSRPRYFQIRGIGERSQYEGAPNPSVGFIVDDLDFSALGGVATLFDVEQIEVLRGPQGTRYGANALAGLIYVRSKAPTATFDAQLTAGVSNDGGSTAGFAFGGPISETLSYRAVAHQSNRDGFRNNVFLGRDDTNQRDELTTRLKFRYQPNDNWQADLTTLHVELDNGYDAFAIDNGFTTYSDRPGRDSQRTSGAVLAVNGSLNNSLSLTSISGVARTDVTFSFDADWGNAEFWDPVIYDFFSETIRDRQSFSQEFRLASDSGLSSFDWVVGISANKLKESNLTTDDGNFEGFGFVSSIAREYQADRQAIFGDLNFALSERLSLNTGLRLEQRDASYFDNRIVEGGPVGQRFNPSESNVGGQIALNFTLNDDVSFYGKVAKGYKAGGFNLGLPPEASNDALLFEGEFLWNYELGARGRAYNNQLTYDAVLFWMDRKKQQVQTSAQLSPNNPNTFVFLTDNIGKGRNIGLEASVRYDVNEQLSLYSNVGWLDTQLNGSSGSGRFDGFGRDQAHAPRYTFAVGGRYNLSDAWFTRLDITGKDAFFFSDSHDQRSEAYSLVNARIGYEQGNWSVHAWARNLFDEEYAMRGFFFGNEPARDFVDTLYVRLGDPREFGVTFNYKFGQ